MIPDLTDSAIWIFGGLVLLGLEVVAPGVFMMWLGIAAIATGLVLLGWDLSFGVQVGIYAAFAALSLAAGLKLRTKPARNLNTQQSGLIGRAAVALAFNGREGRVRLGDSDWSARLAAGAAIPEPGSRLRVDEVDGTVLIVRPEAT